MPRLRQFQLYGEFSNREHSGDFMFQCDSVAGLYERHFRSDIRMPSASKITAYVRSSRTIDHLREVLARLAVDVIDDCSDFFLWEDRAKQESALRWLHSGCVEAANYFGWPLAPFEAARVAVLDASFVNKWVHPHKASRKDKQFRAELYCDHGIYEFRSELVLFKKGAEIARFPDISLKPDRMIFGWELGKVSWISEMEVEIRDVHGSEPRIIDVRSAVSGA